MGENVGVEINGKDSYFARPVVILKKLSRYNFIAIPLTSKQHQGSWYANFVFNNKQQAAVLSQVRNLSVARLYRKMGQLSDSDLNLIRYALYDLIFG